MLQPIELVQAGFFVASMALLEIGSNLESLVAGEVEELQVAVEVPTSSG